MTNTAAEKTATQLRDAGWNPSEYLARVAESDARFLTDTLDLINSRSTAETAAAIGRLTPGMTPPDPASPTLLAHGFGTLAYRTQVIIERLRAAEARVAELEAELLGAMPHA